MQYNSLLTFTLIFLNLLSEQSNYIQKNHVMFVFKLQIDLNIQKAASFVDCASVTSDGNKDLKEVYNISQQSNAGSRRSSSLCSDNLRTEILDRIGEQHYEDVLFRPKQRLKASKIKQKKVFVSETESGSDTMSISSVRSTSDGEDPWSSERLGICSDMSIAARPSEGLNNVQLDKGCSSEETLVILGDCINSDVATLPGDTRSEHDGTIVNSVLNETETPQMYFRGKRPGDLCLGDKCLVPPEIQPDMRSPATIEKDVSTKERILAKALHLDSLYDGDSEGEIISNCKDACDINQTETQDVIAEKVKLNNAALHSCTLSEELHDIKDDDEKTDEWGNQSASRNDDSVSQHSANITDSQDEKLASFSSILSYGPPSDSSAPPSNHTSLETFSTPDCKEFIYDSRLCKAVERVDRWMQYKVPGTIVNLSLCKYYICCVDSKDMVYYSALNGLSLKWQRVDYKAKQVAISPNGTSVWKLHKCTAYCLETPSVKGPFGGRWKEVAGNVRWISVADNIAWFVSDGYIYVHKQLISEPPSSTVRLVHCDQPVTRICCFQNSVIALTSTGEVLFRSGVSHIVPEGKKWKKINVPCPAVTYITLGGHGTAWIVDQKNAIHFSCNFTASDPQWWQVSFIGVLVTCFAIEESTIDPVLIQMNPVNTLTLYMLDVYSGIIFLFIPEYPK
jgi:hypothetical protein